KAQFSRGGQWIDEPDAKGRSALYLAAKKGHHAVVAFLLENKAVIYSSLKGKRVSPDPVKKYFFESLLSRPPCSGVPLEVCLADSWSETFRNQEAWVRSEVIELQKKVAKEITKRNTSLEDLIDKKLAKKGFDEAVRQIEKFKGD